VLSSGTFFTEIPMLLVTSFVLITAGLVPSLVRKVIYTLSKTKLEEEKKLAEAS
jgi:hypothetical protein